MIEEQSAFKIGNTIQACTKGLWLYRKVIQRNDKHVIVLDTEGLGAMDVDKRSDSR